MTRPALRGTRTPSWPPVFVAVALIFGCAFLLIKLSGRGFTPLEVAFLRVGFAAVTVGVMMVVLRVPAPPKDVRLWGHLAVIGLFMNVFPFSLFAIGEASISSALAAIDNGTTSLFTIIFAAIIVPVRPTRAAIWSVLIGFAGVLVIVGVWDVRLGGSLGAQLACLGAAASYGIGIPYTRRFVSDRPESVITTTFAQLVTATCVLAVALAVSGTPVVSDLTSAPTSAWMAIIVLGSVGTGVAWVLQNLLVRLAGAQLMAGTTYIAPVIATILGVLVLGESLSWHQPVGAAVVLGAVWLSRRTSSPARLPSGPSTSATSSWSSLPTPISPPYGKDAMSDIPQVTPAGCACQEPS